MIAAKMVLLASLLAVGCHTQAIPITSPQARANLERKLKEIEYVEPGEMNDSPFDNGQSSPDRGMTNRAATDPPVDAR